MTREERRKAMREAIRHARLKAGLKQKELAELLGVSPAAVSAWEKENGNSVPETLVMFELINLLNLNRDECFCKS